MQDFLDKRLKVARDLRRQISVNKELGEKKEHRYGAQRWQSIEQDF
jgi:hypothetical protein